jgi:Matrixin
VWGRCFRFVVVLVASGAFMAVAALPAGAATATKIDVCCAWNTKITDGITYSISAPTTDITNNIAAAIEEWEAAVPGLTLNPVATRGEVTVKYKRGGGQVQGMAKRSFDRAGFVTSVSINASGSAFGDPNEPAIVAQIVKHEFGHALGANHADGDSTLMSPTVSGGSTTITKCDADAVEAAEHWFLVDQDSTPHQPHAASVFC